MGDYTLYSEWGIERKNTTPQIRVKCITTPRASCSGHGGRRLPGQLHRRAAGRAGRRRGPAERRQQRRGVGGGRPGQLGPPGAGPAARPLRGRSWGDAHAGETWRDTNRPRIPTAVQP